MRTATLNCGRIVVAIETGQYAGCAMRYGNRAMAEKRAASLRAKGERVAVWQAPSPARGFFLAIES